MRDSEDDFISLPKEEIVDFLCVGGYSCVEMTFVWREGEKV